MDRTSFCESRSDIRQTNVKLSATPSPAFVALVNGTPIARKRAELFTKVKTMVAASRLHSTTTPDSKPPPSSSSPAPIRFLNVSTTSLVSPPVSPTPKRESATTAHKPLHTLTQVHQNALGSFPLPKSSDDNHGKLAPTEQENMPRAPTPTEIVPSRTGDVTTTTCDKDKAFEDSLDLPKDGVSMPKVTTVHQGDKHNPASTSSVDFDMIDKLTTENTAGSEKHLVRSQVVASGRSNSRHFLSGEIHGPTSPAGGIILEVVEEARPVATIESQCDTGVGKIRLTRQQSHDEDRSARPSKAAQALCSIFTPTVSHTPNRFGRARHTLKVVHILYIFSLISEAQKYCKTANNHRTKASIIRTVRLGLRCLSRQFEGSTGDRLSKAKNHCESQTSNANLTPKTIWNRLTAELLSDITKTDLPSRLIPLSSTLKLVAGLSPTNTLRASYFVSLFK
ncbi:hypothetical protein V1509DRAFT_64507 [Lipomyces kononenkoae]